MLIATLVLTLLGLVLGGLLGLAAKYFATGDDDPIVKEIEQMLPGSQCGQCGFPGCTPAAEAIANGDAAVTCCPPGGRALAENLARLLDVDMSTLGESPQPLLANIDENLCTGCTRCYKACPTDAIVGASKQIHVVVAKACTGCSQCLEACPEDCISLNTAPVTLERWHWSKPEAA
ncbi:MULTISPECIES: RnfABCDGE type electron transport complex subunit B [unclassified Oceanobacter]|jgi:electron transport complex protein RnfB|uniref:RnfABCDGE type electron transport complex subunit B n=1 Tax=unclassified Oceanobacter TaxID=2620260 RepID=UPI0026E25D25|nr:MULTISPECIES: RnfABCDGE type electron transport complex subunit B [unclassified Oceanobacter]MDO6683700.1 RnfABCDGE type electron transport complex subunit B [Oceanobacter sp. 5_MG-2023]MDP2507224.1 RnfABCDGE type electron transport complex subunit B [Oceanobacter sp. 3_MG-2023]MDP2549401.1 RnfABCDGE type electron transport complex subunit B [Oceanobacter sp. 4_MG-2023]MDP2608317.1 RnfABCDGE type electron transport complex subunit B [Oceanobacter sp. 1_MG-2023]MDP2612202.1 RnfABCDGE type el